MQVCLFSIQHVKRAQCAAGMCSASLASCPVSKQQRSVQHAGRRSSLGQYTGYTSADNDAQMHSFGEPGEMPDCMLFRIVLLVLQSLLFWCDSNTAFVS